MNKQEVTLWTTLGAFAAIIHGFYAPYEAAKALKMSDFWIDTESPNSVLYICPMGHCGNLALSKAITRHKSRRVMQRFRDRLRERLENTDEVAELLLFAPQYAEKLKTQTLSGILRKT
jgi:hypothetical protein